MKPGLFTFQVSDIHFDELLPFARECGVEAVELGVAGYVLTPGFEVERLLEDADRRREISRVIAENGMVVSALNSMCNPLHPDPEIGPRHLEGLKSTIRLAAEMGVGRVVTGAGCPGQSRESRHPAWVTFYHQGLDDVLRYQWQDAAAPVWKELGAFAGDHEVKICIEVHPGTLAYNTETLLRLRDLGGDAIGANFDPSHLLWQGMDPRAVARKLDGCIYHAHAKDTVMNLEAVRLNGVIETRSLEDWKDRAWSFCAMGDGHDAVFWRQVVTSMQAAGYDGVWSIEHEDPTLTSREAVSRSARFLRSLF